jgi:exodeoxyribonuclease V beta subunit
MESEANQLRLESDAYAVKIITIHKSKGLEYPVVFCPYGWEGSIIKGNTITFHENAEAGLPTLDLAPGQNRLHLIQAQNELLAENLRLLYVALTRAKKQCYLVWGCFNTAETSALAYLLHSRRAYGDEKGPADIVAALESDINSKEAEEFLDDLKQLADRSGGSIELVPMPLEKEGEYHQHVTHQKKRFRHEFSGKIDSAWKVASYSYLISKRILDEALPDRDAFSDAHPSLLDERLEVSATKDIFSFPKGTRAGIFFHDLLEHLDFVSKDFDHRNTLVREKLKAHGFDAQWQAPINSMINKILAAPLTLDSPGLTFSSISVKDRINEMEFYFPLNPVTPQKLKKIFQVHAGVDISANFPQRIEKLTFPLAKGFMKGYIDLIVQAAGRFFLIDWKSNYLGSHPQDYGQAALNRTMIHDYYILQYHLYTLALHQFLHMRVPDYSYEKDFGGVFYIFIRGVDPDQGPELGIYKDFPSPAVVSELGRVLIPEFDPRTL